MKMYTAVIVTIASIIVYWLTTRPCYVERLNHVPHFPDLESHHKLTLHDGRIPTWLNVSIIFNGPMLTDLRKFGVSHEFIHPFDGLAGLVKYHIDSEVQTVQTKHMNTSVYQGVVERQVYTGVDFSLSLDWYDLIRKRELPRSDNTNINLYKHGENVLATTDGIHKTSVDVESLTSSPSPEANMFLLSAAHPGVDDKHVYNFIGPLGVVWNSSYNEGSLIGNYSLIRYNKSSSTEYDTIAYVEAPIPWVVHELSVTENYVLYKLDSRRPTLKIPFSDLEELTTLSEEAFCVYILHKTSGKVSKKCDANGMSFSSYHNVNAFEFDGVVTLDLISYMTPMTANVLYKPSDKIQYYSTLYVRCMIDTNSIECKRMNGIDDLELVKINPNLRGKPHRFIWGYGVVHRDVDDVNILVGNNVKKCDMASSNCITWFSPPNTGIGEVQFVPDGVNEDTGVIVVIVNNLILRNTQIYILDSETLNEIATFISPLHTPFGVHGIVCYGHGNNCF